MFGSVHPLVIFFSGRGIKNNLFYKFDFNFKVQKLKYNFSWLKRDDKNKKKGFIKKKIKKNIMENENQTIF